MYGLTQVERCYLASDTAHITDKSFKVFIPRLTPEESDNQASDFSVKLDTSLLVNDISNISKEVSARNYIKAKSMTDYRSYHHGDVFEMEGSKGLTLMGSLPTGVSEWKCPYTKSPHTPNHKHDITAPHEFYKMKYETLNNIDINFGKEMIGVFISGDLFDFRVIHIPDVIPQRGD